jgi:hypothetical protein
MEGTSHLIIRGFFVRKGFLLYWVLFVYLLLR